MELESCDIYRRPGNQSDPVRECGDGLSPDSLMTCDDAGRCSIISKSSGCILKVFAWDFSVSGSNTPDVASERAVSGNDPSGDRMTPPRDTDVSRSEMRLLRDTKRVLEYLSKTDILVSHDVWREDFRQR